MDRRENTKKGYTEDGGLTRDLVVTQEPGKSVHWVLPGKRELSEAVFGTPENPQFGTSLLEHNISQTDNERVASLLRELPFPVAVPEEIRETENGEFTTTSVPTPFSNRAKEVDGRLNVTYWIEVALATPATKPRRTTLQRSTSSSRIQPATPTESISSISNGEDSSTRRVAV